MKCINLFSNFSERFPQGRLILVSYFRHDFFFQAVSLFLKFLDHLGKFENELIRTLKLVCHVVLVLKDILL